MKQEDADRLYQQGQQLYNAQSGERDKNLLQAIEHYESALDYYTFEAYPDKWEAVQQAMTATYDELVRLRQSQPSAGQRIQSARYSRFSLRQIVIVTGVIFALLVVPATAAIASAYLGRGGPSCVSGTLVIDGSTALQPLVEAAAEKYMQQCSQARITVGGGASKTGLEDVEAGFDTVSGIFPGKDYVHVGNSKVAIQIGDSDIFAAPGQSDLVDHQVGINIFTLILNKGVTGIHNLTTQQIQGIYTGIYQNWNKICDKTSGVCGPDLPIVPISRTVNSGTRFTFERYVLNGVATVPGIGLDRTLSSGDAVVEVENNPGSIGYAPLYLAKQAHGVTIVAIDGNDPRNSSLVINNQYKFWNIEHMYTRGSGSQLAQAFINYMYSTDVQNMLAQYNLIPLTAVPQNIRQQHASETQ